MSRTSPVRSILRSAGLPAVTLILVGFFAYNAVLGPNGVLAYKDVREQLDKRNAEYDTLDRQRAAIRNRVTLLGSARGADRDMVEEEVRKQLNVVGKGEIVIPRAPARQ